MSRTVAIGIGFRKACARETIVALVRQAQALAGAEAAWVAGCSPVLATIAEKDRPVLHEAAADLGLELLILPKHALAVADDRTTVVSEAAKACLGVPSVAEASALAAAGPGSSLIVPRIAVADATCAVAAGKEGPPP